MNNIEILDCTLRDGGYCNEWKFGNSNIKKIVSNLVDANINIIECGFLTNTTYYNSDTTRFTDITQLKFLPRRKINQSYVVMVNYGNYNFDLLPEYDSNLIDGIRLAFHKKDMQAALEDCKKIKKRGYKLFIQPMVSLCYSDEDFISLIKAVNDIQPYVFYIVDSFGEMKRHDLTRFFYMVEHNLDDKVFIGFHSHNNMQLSYSNAQYLVELQTTRNLIIDTCVYGMGRGAGNLNTELFTEYLNEYRKTNYHLKPLLNIIDEVLIKFYQQKNWGYSLPNYLSALHSIHPNYAFYLDDKKTLTVDSMNEIFLRMQENMKFEYDKDYIENLYLQYMGNGKTQESHKNDLQNLLKNKEILLIGPGKSSEEEKDKIVKYASQKDIIVIGINHDYPYYNNDFVFISNMRRFREFPIEKRNKCIITNNIVCDDVFLRTKYSDLINDINIVQDNACLMAVRFFMNFNISKITLAGIDGYSHDFSENYAENSMMLTSEITHLDAMNQEISKVLKEYSKRINIEFLTEEGFIHI